MINTPASTNQFCYVPELDDRFLALFPHRFDYIWAEHTQPGAKAEWRTESRHPLSDRLIAQGSHLYGVRFGRETQYAVLDIDAESIYHPLRDPFAVDRMMAALEPLGIVACVPVTSSYSGGIHLYLPFDQPLKSWEIATAIATLLEGAGFLLDQGQLEIFPNVRAYDPTGITLFKAHRLPLQAGSYLLDEQWLMVSHLQSSFVRAYHHCQERNEIQPAALKRALKAADKHRYSLTKRATKFLVDLNAEIETGWTGYGQTNWILGRIALRGYVFGHLISTRGGYLEGEDLISHIIEVATNLPGYSDWCRHQHEIRKRAEEWARCAENSHYFPYKSKRPDANDEISPVDRKPVASWQEWQQNQARGRIAAAIAEMLDAGTLPAGAKARFLALTDRGISGSTLYRHRDLWHPDHLWKTPPDPLSSEEDLNSDRTGGASEFKRSTSLLPPTRCNLPPDKGFSHFLTWIFPKQGVTMHGGRVSRFLERDREVSSE